MYKLLFLFPSLSIFHRRVAVHLIYLYIWHLSCVMASCKAAFPPLLSLVLTSLRLNSLHFALFVDYEGCVLDLSPGVVCTSHGVPTWRKKVRSPNFLGWAPIYVAQCHWYTAASRSRKVHLRSSQQQRLLRILWSRNIIRWEGRFTSCNLADVLYRYRNWLKFHKASFQQKKITLWPLWQKY